MCEGRDEHDRPAEGGAWQQPAEPDGELPIRQELGRRTGDGVPSLHQQQQRGTTSRAAEHDADPVDAGAARAVQLGGADSA